MHAWGGGLEDGRDSLLSAEEATYTDGFDSGFFSYHEQLWGP